MDEEVGKALDCCLGVMKWRLKPSSKRRLHIDVLALCTRMRPVVMVDYGGKLPELQQRLCALLKLIQNESPIFQPLRVMVIEDMIYLIHVGELAKHVCSSLNSKSDLLFVDLEQDPPKIVTQSEQNSVVLQLASIMKLFSLDFPDDEMKNVLKVQHTPDETRHANSSNGENIISQSSELIDLSCCTQDTQVTVPTLNGWLLGYPVVYLFGKDNIPDAVYNLSTKSLHLFKILVCRNSISNKVPCHEELMSFSVPYDLSIRGSSEPWATEFLSLIRKKWESCKPAWRSLQMEVSECNPLAVVL